MGTTFRADIIQLGPNIDLRMGAADPSSGGGVAASVGSFYWQTSTSLIWQKVAAADTAWVYLMPRDLFGDGRDGNGVIAAGTTTLTTDMYYNNLTIQAGATLIPRGTRIFVRGTLTIEATGVLWGAGDDGTAAGVGGQGNPLAAGPVANIGSDGGNGGVAAGVAGAASTNCVLGFAGSGGAGGAGSGGAGAGGGTVTARSADAQGNPFALALAMVAQIGGNGLNRFGAGGGGGGGGGDGTAGGGGGGGGGVLAVFAREVSNAGSITANGGAGGSPAAGNRGGGGGGGGGLIILGTHAFSGTTPTVAGGAAGVGSGTGVNGTAGGDGMYVPLAM